MTLTRLIFVLCIGIALIDYKLNNGRLMDVVVDLANQQGVWVGEKFSRLAYYLAGH